MNRGRERKPGEPIRLLLVEDEALIALMLEDMVEGMGCAVTGLAPVSRLVEEAHAYEPEPRNH